MSRDRYHDTTDDLRLSWPERSCVLVVAITLAIVFISGVEMAGRYILQLMGE